MDNQEYENRLIETISCVAIRLCEVISCEECPVVLNNYDKQTPFQKELQHIPCCDNLMQWIIDKARSDME